MAEEKTTEQKPLTDRYVKPHTKISREVTDADMEHVIEEAMVLGELCFSTHGIWKGAYAVAHPQIDDKDPLRFFVTAAGEIILNPIIINHTKTTVHKEEGCTSYADRTMITVDRWNKCVVEFSYITNEKTIGPRVTQDLSGRDSQVFQHEIGHLDGKYIYETEK